MERKLKVATKKKIPVKPKRVAKKKNAKRVPPLRAGLRPKKEKAIRLEVGKTYSDAIGNRAKVIHKDRFDDQGLPFKVEWKTGQYKGCHFWTAEDGTFFDKTMPGFNLIREVVKRRGK